MAITIRQATTDDIPTVVEFNCRLARESEHLELDRPTVIAGVTAVVKNSDRTGPYYLACDGEVILGQLQITFEWSDWRNGWFWWVQSVYVRADARGRGIYRALYDHVRQTARAAGNVVGMRLYVERNNDSAKATYQRLGMEEIPFHLMQELLEPGIA